MPCWIVVCFVVVVGMISGARAEMAWKDLPPLPVPMSGHFSGTHGGALIVAGGSNFPVSPFQGGEKQWLDRIYVLEPGAEAWIDAGQLPQPRAYGGTVSTPEGVFLIGGTDGQTCFESVLRLAWKGGAVSIDAAGTIPVPLAFHGAALVGKSIYLTGGQSDPKATEALNRTWSWAYADAGATWEEVEALPGGSRMLPVVLSRDDSLYVFSGASLFKKDDGTPGRVFLNDGYRYTPGKGWKTLTGPPVPLVAAPALPWGQAHILVSSGDDGKLFEQSAELGDGHPGFPKTIWAYHTITDTWVEKGTVPQPTVTTQAVLWQDRMVIPGGEDRPGHRMSSVLSGVPMAIAKSLGWLDYGALGLYFAALVYIGIYCSRREANTEVYFLGGGRIPWWALGISIFGTSLSSITYLAIPANAYATNWVGFLSNTCIVLVAPFVVWLYVPRYRNAKVPTAYTYLEQRFNLAVRIYGSLVFMLFQFGRMAIVLYLPAITLSASTGLSIEICILATGVLATFYTMMGGIEAVIWTDVVQSIVLLAGAVLALYLVATNIDGGVVGAFATAVENDKFHTFNWTWDMTTTAVWVCLVGNFFAMLYPYTADQTMVQRYLSARNENDAKRAVWVNAALTIPVSVIFFGLGTALFVYFKHHPGQLDPTLKNDAILPVFVMAMFPTGMKGVLISGVFAAAMSSLDSSMNSMASVLVNDYYRRFKGEVSEVKALGIARWLTVLLGGLGTGAAWFLAGTQATSLFDTYMKLLGMAGGGLAGVVALGMFTKRASGWGVLAGAAVSAVAVYYVNAQNLTHFYLHGMIGFLVSFFVGYIASLLAPRKVDTAPQG
ncbi:MAG: sodium/solute symporter [Candidatus Hydrogenedentes bacterium]|nr:sodium/solute symporter [Candidatus Hydrogenedentota bacterium]